MCRHTNAPVHLPCMRHVVSPVLAGRMLVVHFTEQNGSLIDEGDAKFDRAKCSCRDTFDVFGLFQCLMSGAVRWVDVEMLCYGRKMPSSSIFYPNSLPWHLFHLKFHCCHILVFLTEYVIPCFKWVNEQKIGVFLWTDPFPNVLSLSVSNLSPAAAAYCNY